jgi:hypothetical protein
VERARDRQNPTDPSIRHNQTHPVNRYNPHNQNPSPTYPHHPPTPHHRYNPHDSHNQNTDRTIRTLNNGTLPSRIRSGCIDGTDCDGCIESGGCTIEVGLCWSYRVGRVVGLCGLCWLCGLGDRPSTAGFGLCGLYCSARLGGVVLIVPTREVTPIVAPTRIMRLVPNMAICGVKRFGRVVTAQYQGCIVLIQCLEIGRLKCIKTLHCIISIHFSRVKLVCTRCTG